jgi:hypothetical protein
MKKALLLVVAGIMVATCTHAESAHKGWGTAPAEWPRSKSPRPAVHSVGLQGPWVSINQPDPPTNAPLGAGYCFRTGSVVTAQRVYKLVVNVDGTVNTMELKTTTPVVSNNEVTDGYHCASFRTENVSFKEGDLFVMVLKVDGRTIPFVLKMTYSPFVPS